MQPSPGRALRPLLCDLLVTCGRRLSLIVPCNGTCGGIMVFITVRHAPCLIEFALPSLVPARIVVKIFSWREIPLSVTVRSQIADILLLYPDPSLQAQIGLWASRHPERQVATSRERSLPEIRRLLGRSGAALIDATGDPSRATDAFLQGVAQSGGRRRHDVHRNDG